MARAFEFYPTDEAVTRRLLRHVLVCGRVGEVCAGEMDMARVLRQHTPHCQVVTNDIRPMTGVDYTGDATRPDAPIWSGRFDWVVTNPPFSQAFDILRLAWENTAVGVAMLLRLTFLEPVGGRYDDDGFLCWPEIGKARGQWLSDHERDLSHLIIFGSPRPSFTGNGSTDSVTTAWMVWQHGHRNRYGRWQGGTQVIFAPGWKGGGDVY